MANIAQLDLLRRSVAGWNAWRKEYPEAPIDLSRADLRNANLSEIDLSDANLSDADLTQANLSGTDLSGTDLSYVNLNNADLNRADISGADLRNANLIGANFIGANFIGTDLSLASLNDANLHNASIGNTAFGDCDFRQMKGLDTIKHNGPSPLSINSIYLSKGDIPKAFVQGTGAPDTFLEYMHALTGRPIEYYTCFISYSSKDQIFTERLYNDLQGNSVRCWYAPEDLKAGDFFWKRIDESIRLYDKLVVVLSSHSVESDWVEREVMAALEKEGQQNRPVLFPLRLDDAVKTTSTPWAADMRRRRHITDFTGWETDYTVYQAGLSRVLRNLKQEKA